jgi:hypothetical protein
MAAMADDVTVVITPDLTKINEGFASLARAFERFAEVVAPLASVFSDFLKHAEETHLGYSGKGRPRPASTWLRPHRPPRRR